MTTCNISNSQLPATSFHKLTADQLREMFSLKLINSCAYVLLIIQTHRAANWRWRFKVKDFCSEWQINQRAFYRAIARLKSLGKIHWQANDAVTVWWSSNAATDTVSQSADDNKVSDISIKRHDTNVSAMTQMSVKIAEAPIKREVESATDISSNYLISTTNSEGENIVCGLKEIEPEKEPERRRPETESSPLDEQEVNGAFNRLRGLGVLLNPTIRQFVRTLNAEIVLDAIAHIEERVKARENFKNLEGAIVTAFKRESKPERSHLKQQSYPQPTKEQLEALKIAKRSGSIRDYYSAPYRGGQTVLIDDPIKRCVLIWWEWFGLPLDLVPE